MLSDQLPGEQFIHSLQGIGVGNCQGATYRDRTKLGHKLVNYSKAIDPGETMDSYIVGHHP